MGSLFAYWLENFLLSPIIQLSHFSNNRYITATYEISPELVQNRAKELEERAKVLKDVTVLYLISKKKRGKKRKDF